jgi:gentisate 1,2-dioxygenase
MFAGDFCLSLPEAFWQTPHQGGLVIYVLEGEGAEGRGYTILDDERYEWEAGDVMTLPLRQGRAVISTSIAMRVSPSA